MIKPPKLTMVQQFGSLKRYYSFGNAKMIGENQLMWKGKLKSSPIGNEYMVKVLYKKESIPEVFVLEPKRLRLPKGKTKLMHVYDHEKQKLCLYYPRAKEWDNTKTIASTIMPWVIEWLYHYEIWLITDEWAGGGVHSVTGKK